MDIKRPEEQKTVSIEILIDPAGIPEEELDEKTRRLASELRQVPHKSVGIIANQLPSAGKSNESASEGTIAMTLDPKVLPRVLELLETFTPRRSIKLRGPTAIELDLASPNFNVAADAWLNAMMKHSQNVSGSQIIPRLFVSHSRASKR